MEEGRQSCKGALGSYCIVVKENTDVWRIPYATVSPWCFFHLSYFPLYFPKFIFRVTTPLSLPLPLPLLHPLLFPLPLPLPFQSYFHSYSHLLFPSPFPLPLPLPTSPPTPPPSTLHPPTSTRAASPSFGVYQPSLSRHDFYSRSWSRLLIVLMLYETNYNFHLFA